MTEWCTVRKKGQVERVVSAVWRGWEEYKERFPYRAHCQRLEWSKTKEAKCVKAWLEAKEGSKEGKESEEELMELERLLMKNGGSPRRKQVEKWLQGGGEVGKM